MMDVMLYGAGGKMGQVLEEQIALQEDMRIAVGIDKSSDNQKSYPVHEDPFEYKEEVHVLIDFSHPSNLEKILDYALSKKLPAVIATTGYSDEQIKAIEEAAKTIPVFYSSNMSTGVNVLARLLKEAAKTLGEDFDIEIIEKHHNKKIDSPSGTAYLLAEEINKGLPVKKEYIYGREGNNCKRSKDEIGIHSIRGGTIPGEHTVIFAGNDEIIEFTHTALSKNIFAAGAIRGARRIVNAEPGLYRP